jgi:hypothetical protein
MPLANRAGTIAAEIIFGILADMAIIPRDAD